jgi:mono/diheme cytochrome c family protein
VGYSLAMLRILGLSFFCCLLAAPRLAAAAPAEPAGKPLYLQYCASCHGVDGRGGGPVASSLREPPPDLTTMAQRSGGSFDLRATMTIIDGERAVAAHGTREMPVWGEVFGSEGKALATRVRLLRTQVLAEYLGTLQR